MLNLLYHAYLGARRVIDVAAEPKQDRDERYLAESVDIYDLERRIREIDSGRTNAYGIGSTGIFTR